MITDTLNKHDYMYVEWKKFIAAKRLHPSNVHPLIAESWLRCLRAGVNPYNNENHHFLDPSKLTKALREKEALIEIAKPFMSNLHKFVKGSGFVVVLTDENGYILELFGDDDNLQNSLTNNFFLGASWDEVEAGTNAIGTTLVLGAPIQVSGAEHYCQKYHCLTCSAAPILDADGRIIGVLDMSGSSFASHLHTLGMVVAAAEAITAQLSLRRKNNELALINTRLTNFFNTVSDGVILVDKRDAVIDVNPAAATILGHSLRQIQGMPISRLLEKRVAAGKGTLSTGQPYHDVEVMIDMKDGGCYCLASGEPIHNEYGQVTGGIIILRPIKQVQNLVNRYSGYSAALQFKDIIGDSAEIREVVHFASLAAANASNVLLQGESGTGKEIFAQAVHNSSAQHAGPFIALNCGAIPRELIGSELFGYEEGAFTGARRGGKPGKFELATGGTLFLDEIGDMPLEQQIALLRVIQEKKVSRIGGDKMIPISVRLICATNKNLFYEVEKGTFRQDLFYRLNVMAITIPPLRNRKVDIPLLFHHFLDKLGNDWGRSFHADWEVVNCLLQYHWPGNVRELQNVVERAASLAENGSITMRHLPTELQKPGYCQVSVQGSRYNEVPDCREERQKLAKEAERHRILSLLNQYAGNVSQVARVLGVARKTLYSKMRQYEIQN